MLLRAENDSIRQKIDTVSRKLMLKEGSPLIPLFKHEKKKKKKALGACLVSFLVFQNNEFG